MWDFDWYQNRSTLNDPEQRGSLFCVITLKVLDFKANCIKLVQVIDHTVSKVQQNCVVFGNI